MKDKSKQLTKREGNEMSKWVEVTVKIINQYIVEIEDNQPIELAGEVISQELFDFDEIETSLINDSDIEAYKRIVDKDKVYSL
jgi:hypothetical protein